MARSNTPKKALSSSEKVLHAAARLLRTGGAEAVSTRAVAAAAGVQPPAIYRQFGDKEGLLDAVALFTVQEYFSDKRRIAAASDDPLEELRSLWDLHIRFGLTHPDTYVLTYGQPRPGRTTPAVQETLDLLGKTIARLAVQGRLQMSVERATSLVHAGGVGTVLTLIPVAEEDRDPRLQIMIREKVLASILSDSKRIAEKSSQISSRAIALQEALRRTRNAALSASERTLLMEWLGRLADQS